MGTEVHFSHICFEGNMSIFIHKIVSVFLFMAIILPFTQSTTLTKAFENCRPEKIAVLPEQLQKICMSLMNKILESDYDDLKLLVRSQRASSVDNADVHELLDNGEIDPNHVFLRFGRAHHPSYSTYKH